MSENLRTESKGIEIAGLWESEKGHFSGKVKLNVDLKDGEYLCLFKDKNPNPKSPEFNLVVFREIDYPPEGQGTIKSEPRTAIKSVKGA
jgi:hypothetical protein